MRERETTKSGGDKVEGGTSRHNKVALVLASIGASISLSHKQANMEF